MQKLGPDVSVVKSNKCLSNLCIDVYETRITVNPVQHTDFYMELNLHIYIHVLTYTCTYIYMYLHIYTVDPHFVITFCFFSGLVVFSDMSDVKQAS